MLKRSIVASALIVAATSCTTAESPDQPISQMCSHSRTSTEGKLVQRMLGTEQYKINIRNTNDDLTEKMNENLREWKPEISAPNIQTCALIPAYPKTSGGNTLGTEFSWTSRESPAPSGRPADTHSYYNLNGTYGESDETLAKLHIECDLPGELSTLSKRTLLVARSWNTAYTGPRESQDARDRQMHYLHLMARKATDALGCENEPLEKDPVIKGFETPEEAAEAAR
ncbi:hypothetical protein F0344_12730 [Streptomyces finlayi]|uniref:DUF3558 domain-containing protein n=1 Tax=Streptomyces finlayi TaxID=67296 RepID=A0A7G7BJ55_9ACTN|nr:hypothetical protein F0344_12730 [Streptomyces finlayi]